MSLLSPLWELGVRLRTISLAVATASALFVINNAAAEIAPQLHLDAEARTQLQQIELNLNAVRTVRSTFLQNSSNGERTQGELYLSRPGKLRIEYRPPTPILVVADGQFLIYFDRALEQVSYVPLSATPAGILLEKHISFDDKNLSVTNFEHADGTLRVSVVRNENPGEGSITLIFDESSFALLQWSITDAQGISTLVTLVDPHVNIDVDETLFRFKDPRVLKRDSP